MITTTKTTRKTTTMKTTTMKTATTTTTITMKTATKTTTWRKTRRRKPELRTNERRFRFEANRATERCPFHSLRVLPDAAIAAAAAAATASAPPTMDDANSRICPCSLWGRRPRKSPIWEKEKFLEKRQSYRCCRESRRQRLLLLRLLYLRLSENAAVADHRHSSKVGDRKERCRAEYARRHRRLGEFLGNLS